MDKIKESRTKGRAYFCRLCGHRYEQGKQPDDFRDKCKHDYILLPICKRCGNAKNTSDFEDNCQACIEDIAANY